MVKNPSDKGQAWKDAFLLDIYSMAGRKLMLSSCSSKERSVPAVFCRTALPYDPDEAIFSSVLSPLPKCFVPFPRAWKLAKGHPSSVPVFSLPQASILSPPHSPLLSSPQTCFTMKISPKLGWWCKLCL